MMCSHKLIPNLGKDVILFFVFYMAVSIYVSHNKQLLFHNVYYVQSLMKVMTFIALCLNPNFLSIFQCLFTVNFVTCRVRKHYVNIMILLIIFEYKFHWFISTKKVECSTLVYLNYELGLFFCQTKPKKYYIFH
ncbi:hypothetical protein RND81_09G052200 [Saponaria officinalis]|uniref:Uncharacterized protein n=1 Tax=Saponaria officinalis TaxID=3572 RepID=A0AAW1IHP0_SAPOF